MSHDIILNPTQLAALEEKGLPWSKLTNRGALIMGELGDTNQSAQKLMLNLIAIMGRHSAVVASYAALGDLTGKSVSTMRRAVQTLSDKRLIQVVQLQDRGSANLYIVDRDLASRYKGPPPALQMIEARVLYRDSDAKTKGPLVRVRSEEVTATTTGDRCAARSDGRQMDLEDYILPRA